MFCINGASIHRAQATLYGATVTVNDPQAPAVGSLSGGLVGGGWLRGPQTVALSASDATGISALDLTRDGGVGVRAQALSCDDRLPAPCAGSGTSASSSWAAVDTSLLADGSHTFVGTAKDSAANPASSAAVNVQTDNTPPVAPVGVTGGSPTWSRVAMRTLQWVLPGGQVAPITAAQVDVCRQGGSCFSPAATTTSSSFSLPAEGAYTATIRLVDAAGNVGAVPATVALGWDTGAPPPPVLGSVQPNGGGTYLISVNTSNDPGPAPVASVVGEACPQSGGTCRSFVASGSPPSYATFDLPAAGLWMITARTVDAAGNTGPSAMTTYTVPAAATPTPTPTTPPTPGQSPAPSVSPQPTATTTPAFTVAPTETPTTTATATAAPRRRPGLRLTKARLTRTRVIVRGVIAADAAGAVSVSARGRTRALRIGGGSFAGSLRLPKRAYGAKRVRLTAAYVGDEAFLPRTRRQVLRRR